MDQLAKDTVDKFAGFKANKNKSLIKMNNGMKQFTKFSRQDHKTAHPFPEIIRNRAVYTGEGWAKDTFVCDGNPIIDLKKWKEFINKKEWGFTHEAFRLQMSDIWKISSGSNQKEMETKLKNGELLIGNDVESSYLSYLLALSEKINPLFQKKMSDLFGDKHKEAPIKKQGRCQNKLRGKYRNKPIPKGAELTDTIRCLVVFDD